MGGYIFTILEPTDTNLVFVKKNCYPHADLMELLLLLGSYSYIVALRMVCSESKLEGKKY